MLSNLSFLVGSRNLFEIGFHRITQGIVIEAFRSTISLLARLTGAPYFPITPTFPLLGPLGVVPLPSKWRIEFCEPIEVADYGPDAAEDRALVFELSERVRDTIQHKLYENLVKRGSAFL